MSRESLLSRVNILDRSYLERLFKALQGRSLAYFQGAFSDEDKQFITLTSGRNFAREALPSRRQ